MLISNQNPRSCIIPRIYRYLILSSCTVLLDQLVPCTSIELLTLCQLLDAEEAEEINYHELKEGLRHFQERETAYTEDDIRPTLVLTKREFDHCPSCQMAIWDGEPYKPEIPRHVIVL